MTPTPTRAQRQADATCAELDQLWHLLAGGPTTKNPGAHYATLRRLIHTAIARDNEPHVVDGYKTRNGDPSSGGGNSDSTSVETAALRLVLGGQPADIVHAAVTRIVINVRQARDRIVAIDNALQEIPQAAPVTVDESTWCTSCLRFNIHTPRSNQHKRCGWCRDFHAEHGMDAPEALVRQRAEGRRITTSDLAKHLPANPPFRWRDGSTTGTHLDPPPAA
jgi:hypothetical protein